MRKKDCDSNKLYSKGSAAMFTEDADIKRFNERYPSGSGEVKKSTIADNVAIEIKHKAEHPRRFGKH